MQQLDYAQPEDEEEAGITTPMLNSSDGWLAAVNPTDNEGVNNASIVIGSGAQGSVSPISGSPTNSPMAPRRANTSTSGSSPSQEKPATPPGMLVLLFDSR